MVVRGHGKAVCGKVMYVEAKQCKEKQRQGAVAQIYAKARRRKVRRCRA